MNVVRISSKEAKPWIMRKHYAHRMPAVQFAYGLYDKRILRGVITYGPPPTPTIKQAIFRGFWQDRVYELNRLCVDVGKKNASSILVSHSLKLLPTPACIVSYADTAQGHVGYIYQATNFIFTGAVTAHDCEYMVDNVKTHPRTLASRGITAPMKWAKENDIKIIKPKPKNRYVYLLGTKKEKKEMLSKLVYPILPYPKGETKQYDQGGKVPTQIAMFDGV